MFQMQKSTIRRTHRLNAAGFTLIELLVVIAIIAILAAILFPVFAAAREKARQATALSNMHEISVALGQFRLDKNRAPEVLFGYAYPTGGVAGGAIIPMDKAAAQAQTDGKAAAFFPGLYPSYIKSYQVFQDPNNPITDLSKDTSNLPVNFLCNFARANTDVASACSGYGLGALVSVNRDFYQADAMDVSPQVQADYKSLNSTAFIPRYQFAWTSITPSLDGVNVLSPATGRNDFPRQLALKTQPGDTYVTSTTYHVPNTLVLVLFEDGMAKTMPASQFFVNGPDSPIGATTGPMPGTNVSAATFWKVTPNGK